MAKGNGKSILTALVAGATGLVGSSILRQLSVDERFTEIRALVRRPLPDDLKLPRVMECISDFDKLNEHSEWFKVDVIFSALGTTIAKAHTQSAFRKVDFDYALAAAAAGRTAGARHYLLVSAMGADGRSRFFYNRVKGELENAVLALGFPDITIARPSMLLGNRVEFRLVEKMAKPFAWLVPPPFAPIEAKQVAACLVKSAMEDTPGVRILENRQLHSC